MGFNSSGGACSPFSYCNSFCNPCRSYHCSRRHFWHQRNIFGIKEIKITAERKAKEAVESTIAEYPQAADFLDVYRQFQAQLAEFKREYDVWQKRSEEASAILIRLNASGTTDASNTSTDDENGADKGTEAISASYPGKEASS